MLVSVMLPFQPAHAQHIEPFADLVLEHGCARLWMGQSTHADASTLYAALAGRRRVPSLGTAVSLMPLEHPAGAALRARALVQVTGGPVTMGFGVSEPDVVRHLLGSPYASPLDQARQYLRTFREATSAEGTNAFVTAAPRPHPIELALGVLGPRMYQVAAQEADAALTMLISPEGLVRLQSAHSGTPRMVAVVPVLPEGPAAAAAVEQAFGSHLSRPHYRAALIRDGLPATATTGAAARWLLESLAVLQGPPEQINEGIDAYKRAGCDEIVLNAGATAVGQGLSAARSHLCRLLSTVGGLTRAK